MEVYIDALDYDQFDSQNLIMVLESQEFENRIDHYLNEHVRTLAHKNRINNSNIRLL